MIAESFLVKKWYIEDPSDRYSLVLTQLVIIKLIFIECIRTRIPKIQYIIF